MLVSFFHLDILSAMTLSSVVTRSDEIATGLPISKVHWMRPKLRPTSDRLHPFMVHASADVLSALIITLGCGLSLDSRFPSITQK